MQCYTLSGISMISFFQAIDPYIKDRKTRCRLRATCTSAKYTVSKPKSLRPLALKLKFYRVPKFRTNFEMVDNFYKIIEICTDYTAYWKFQEVLYIARTLLENTDKRVYFKTFIEMVIFKLNDTDQGTSKLTSRLQSILA